MRLIIIIFSLYFTVGCGLFEPEEIVITETIYSTDTLYVHTQIESIDTLIQTEYDTLHIYQSGDVFEVMHQMDAVPSDSGGYELKFRSSSVLMGEGVYIDVWSHARVFTNWEDPIGSTVYLDSSLHYEGYLGSNPDIPYGNPVIFENIGQSGYALFHVGENIPGDFCMAWTQWITYRRIN